MVFRSRQWRHPVFALALAASSVAVVCDPALGQASPEPPTSIISEYKPLLIKHLVKHVNHPDWGKVLGPGGRIDLSFFVDYQGKVLDARVERSTGSAARDSEALALFIKLVSPVPASPSELVGHRFMLPIHFRTS